MSTKVVINRCFGGFSLSEDGIREYLKRKGLKIHREEKSYSSTIFYIDDGSEEGKFFYDRAIDRDDPDLVAVVEELGAAADGFCAELGVEEVPTGVQYRIDEYDGREHIEYRDSIDWSVG